MSSVCLILEEAASFLQSLHDFTVTPEVHGQWMVMCFNFIILIHTEWYCVEILIFILLITNPEHLFFTYLPSVYLFHIFKMWCLCYFLIIEFGEFLSDIFF